MENLIKNISFFKNINEIEKIIDSLSGAGVFRVKDGNKNYFLKIMNQNQDDLLKIEDIVKIYKTYNNNALELIDSGIINQDLIYTIYNWIDGYALNKKYDELSNKDYYDYGVYFGNQFKQINTKEPIQNKFIKEYDFDKFTSAIIDNFISIYSIEKEIQNIFPEEYLNEIIILLKKLSKYFTGDKEYIHGDVHPKNVMINQNKDLVIIDIESFCIDYFVMNFRWSLTSAFVKEGNKYFFKGVIDGRYEKDLPENLFNQMLYVLIFKFFEQTVSYYSNKDLEFVLDYIKKYKQIFDSITLDDKNTDFLK